MNQKQINQAAQLLWLGKLVAFPTETVYGLGADATNEAAVKNVFVAKQRPMTHPLIVHVASVDALGDWAQAIPQMALTLANAFWPGPLTLILKKQPWVSKWVTGGQDTVGLRVPNHPVAKALLDAFGGGIVAPSANQFTHLSPTTAQAVHDELGDQIDLVLEGGACDVGLESTIIDLTVTPPLILRPGMISAQEIEATLGTTVALRGELVAKQTIRAPGDHPVHYAPLTRTVCLVAGDIAAYANELVAKKQSVAVLSSQYVYAVPHQKRLVHDPKPYAYDFYQALRELDQLGVDCIIIEALPDAPEWAALRDRIGKASGRG